MEETILSSGNQCSFHQNQLYQFYCRDCKDCVCVECVPALHKKHVFCNLEDAEDDIRQEMHNYITDNQEENKKLNKMLDVLKQKLDDIAAEKIGIEQEIENLADTIKRKIDTSKRELISSLEAVYEENNGSVLSVRDRVQKWKLNLNKIKDGNFEDSSFLQVVNIVDNLRKCIRSAEDIDKILKRPILLQNYIVCNIGMLDYKVTSNDQDINHDSSKSTVLTRVSVYTQTENLDDVESDTEWFDVEDSQESEYVCENSSDEIKDEYPLTITLDDDTKNISKIVPISNRDAWVIVQRNLQKIQGLILEKEIFANSVDDIALLEDDSVLLLSKSSNVIMRLLPNKRLVRFVSVSSIPHCICTTANKSVLITLHHENATCNGRYATNKDTSYVVEINQDGIKSSEVTFEICERNYPFAMDTFNYTDSHVYVLYQNSSYNNGYSTVVKIDKNNGTSLAQFSGICGMWPAKDFKCYGILCDSDNILVSDNIHHKIYALDKDLNFKKCIVDASHGLESPKAIALNYNLLWVSDQCKIFIFKYD